MSEIGDFQKNVTNLLGGGFNFQVDRPHGLKPVHVDLTVKLPTIDGAEKVSVDFNGNVLGGSTNIRNLKFNW